MAQENIKDFTIEWTVLGLLFTALVSFAVVFMFANNTIGFDGDNQYFLDQAENVSSSNLLEVNNEANIALNITAQTNPEASFLGSRDSVSTSFNAAGQGRDTWDSMKQLIGWVFEGDIGKMLISVLGGLMGYLIFYFSYKFIRSGN